MYFSLLKILFVTLPFIWLSGCATHHRPSPQQLAQAKTQVAAEQIPSPLQDDFIQLYSEGPRNRVFHAMRGGLEALRMGEFELAARTFDLAIRDVEAMQEGARQAQRAKSKFVPEEEKWFKGEPYERSALFFYRGLLYLKAQDFGNAAACFKRTQLQDITSDDAKNFRGDWYSAEMALALALIKSASEGEAQAALHRADRYHSKQGNVPPPTDETRMLVVVEVGEGPVKYRSGNYGELLCFDERPTHIQKIRARFEGQQRLAAAAEDLYFQATTRGNRKVDGILAGKAVFKETTDNIGTAAILGGVVAASTGNREAGYAGAALLLGGLIAKGISAASRPEADVRCWDNLPHSIYLLNLPVSRSDTTITIEATNSSGSKVYDATTFTVNFNPKNTVNVAFVGFN